MRRATHIDERNYSKEAQDLIKDLCKDDLYKLYEIVCNQQQQRQSSERYKELSAVQKAIEKTSGIDYTRLMNMLNGHKSEMARDLNLGDIKANQKKNKRKN